MGDGLSEGILKAFGEAEIYLSEPTIVLAKTRYIGERIAELIAQRKGIQLQHQEPQQSIIRRLRACEVISESVAQQLDALRTLGNDAVHAQRGTPGNAMKAVQIARVLIASNIDDTFFYTSQSESGRRFREHRSVRSKIAAKRRRD